MINEGVNIAVSFVLITTSPGHEREVYDQLSKITEIIELHLLFGQCDFIAKIKAEDYDKLGDIVIKKIRTVMGIVDTKTLTGIKF